MARMLFSIKSGKSIFNMIGAFLQKAYLLQELNATHFTLFPKENLTKLNVYRLISLCYASINLSPSY